MDIYLLMLIVVLYIGYTSKIKFISVLCKALGLFGIPTAIGSIFTLGFLCYGVNDDFGVLGYGFCGEITGILNVFFTGVLIGLGTSVLATVYMMLKKPAQS